MLKHIVLISLAETAEGKDRQENARLAKEKLEALNGRIPGLLKLEVGIDILGKETSADLAIYSEFESLEALEAYQTHPEHLAVAAFVQKIAVGRRDADYEV